MPKKNNKTEKNTEIETIQTASKNTKKVAKTATSRKASTSKKATSSKNVKPKAIKEKTSKENLSKTKTTKKNKSNKNSNNKSLLNTNLTKEYKIIEYYDLPSKYEKTVVKILAQTPTTLFVYWDISEEDRMNFIFQYGSSFFQDTKPVLIITNKTMNYSFELDINDFANCWYLHVNDSKCEYHIELGRRPINRNINLPNNYLYISSSNNIEAPNDHILLEKAQNMVYFRNVKTNEVSSRPMLSFIYNLGRYYNIYDFYKNSYKNEDFSDATKLMGNSSSVFK